jgi:uncharacterized OsmC-like protein
MASRERELNSDYVDITRSGDDEVATAVVRDKHELELDEPEWIPGGNDAAPWPSNYLLVATAGCQVEVIVQALTKARIDDYDIHVHATMDAEDLGDKMPEYPEHLSWRYTTIHMEVTVETPEANEEKVQRLLDLAEDFCMVSRSVERGIEFDITKTLDLKDAIAD